MQNYDRKTHGPLSKGTLFMDAGGWVGIIFQAERTKKYDPNNIIQCVEIYGFSHELGSKYADEVRYLLNEKEFETQKTELGFTGEKNIFKGKLIEN